ncbi:MAG TPA: alpha-1,4-glucan--maltose-1-phosphate maltosyltransferase [Actinomycetota bacterium]|nr:alpha-1,4-glucan--maltose-1-phosphate maltosyltransferase [Actinomycetota bacterium]
MGDTTTAVRAPHPMPGDGRRRVVIEGVWPEIDAGRFAIKRTAGEEVWVEADVFTDGHDEVACVLRHRHEHDDWHETPMEPAGNDRWRASFIVEELGSYRYTVLGWVDRFATWTHGLRKKVDAGQDVRVDLAIGAGMVGGAARRARGQDAARLRSVAKELRRGGRTASALALGEELARLVAAYPDRRYLSTYVRELSVTVDRERARFSAWYELFPRSTSDEPKRHGTFDDVIARLPYLSELGFDVLYLPPIHPIGRTHRKGRNNTPVAGPGDPGSPWAIGAEEGGHTAVHPELGTFDDFERLVAAAARHGIEVALDIAFQCSPDHPWVREHPSWFRLRPDGTVQYAENPPKRYEDIYPLDFETADWKALWEALCDLFRFWIGHGVRIFRVDNPHTKPFAFWEWAIAEIKADHPDVIFLSEAFTRPKVMYRLAKVGFTQSYTYFAWRTSKQELTDYFTELTRTGAAEFFRPSLWPNTPDILTAFLQQGGRPAFAIRFVLAATLGASYGIYGPTYERCEGTPRDAGSEEYRNSEKYEIRAWDIGGSEPLQDLIARVNRIRREHPALQTNATLRFHATDSDQLIAYSKTTEDRADAIVVIVNLDPANVQSGWTDLALWDLGLEADADVEAVDLLTGDRFEWRGARNFVRLDPTVHPAHILVVRAATAHAALEARG